MSRRQAIGFAVAMLAIAIVPAAAASDPLHTMSNGGTPVPTAAVPSIVSGLARGGSLQHRPDVRLLGRNRFGFTWWTFHGQGKECFESTTLGEKFLTGSPFGHCAFPRWSPVVDWSAWMCLPGYRFLQATEIIGVAVDAVATVTAISRSGRVAASVKVVDNLYSIPYDVIGEVADNEHNATVKVVFRDQAGKVVLTQTAGPSRCRVGELPTKVSILPT
jgi:hypothetical protein